MSLNLLSSPVEGDIVVADNNMRYQYMGNGVWHQLILDEYLDLTTYDPNNRAVDVFDRQNHVNQITIADVNNLAFSLNTQSFSATELPIVSGVVTIPDEGTHFYTNLTEDISVVIQASETRLISLHLFQPASGNTYTAIVPGTWLKGNWEYSTDNDVVNEIVIVGPVNSKYLVTSCVLT